MLTNESGSDVKSVIGQQTSTRPGYPTSTFSCVLRTPTARSCASYTWQLRKVACDASCQLMKDSHCPDLDLNWIQWQLVQCDSSFVFHTRIHPGTKISFESGYLLVVVIKRTFFGKPVFQKSMRTFRATTELGYLSPVECIVNESTRLLHATFSHHPHHSGSIWRCSLCCIGRVKFAKEV